MFDGKPPFEIFRNVVVVISPYNGSVARWPARGMTFNKVHELLRRKLIKAYVIEEEETYFAKEDLSTRS